MTGWAEYLEHHCPGSPLTWRLTWFTSWCCSTELSEFPDDRQQWYTTWSGNYSSALNYDCLWCKLESTFPIILWCLKETGGYRLAFTKGILSLNKQKYWLRYVNESLKQAIFGMWNSTCVLTPNTRLLKPGKGSLYFKCKFLLGVCILHESYKCF